MPDETKIEIIELKEFPLRPTKEQLREIKIDMGVNPDLEGIEVVKEFHRLNNIEFDEDKYLQSYIDRIIY